MKTSGSGLGPNQLSSQKEVVSIPNFEASIDTEILCLLVLPRSLKDHLSLLVFLAVKGVFEQFNGSI